ncbi:MAG: HPr family phosphocarrier protein [Alphaproteobacteria bacterium]|nr:HPr family phosphocarrier protein [Alphaproteobacteria bacterium]
MSEAPAAPPPGPTNTRTVTIVNRRGLHARAAARFVKTAERFKADVTVVRKDQVVSGLSIMGLMMLAAGPGSTLELRATGEEADAALDALAKLVADKFDED